MNDTILQGGERSHIVLILANLSHLQYLRLNTSFKGSPLGFDILELLSSGKYLPKLKQYTYSECLLDPLTFHDPRENQTLARTDSPKLILKDKIDPEENHVNPELVVKSSSIEEISVDGHRADLGMVTRMLRIPFALKTFSFSYSTGGFRDFDPFTLVEFCDTMKPQSHSLQDITISFPVFRWPRAGVPSDEASLGSLRDFHVLKKLSIPFDALLGPEPDTTHGFAHLLPNSLESICLGNCMFIRPNALPTWTSTDIHRVLISGAVDLASRCPKLQILTITCLRPQEFTDFRADMSSQEVNYEVSFGFSDWWAMQGDGDDDDDDVYRDYDDYDDYNNSSEDDRYKDPYNPYNFGRYPEHDIYQ